MKPHLALIFCLTQAFSAAAQDAAPVTAKEIQDTWVGKMLIGAASNNAAVAMQLKPDGAATLSAGSINDSGTWRLSEQGYCTTWKSIRAGQERCYTVTRAGAKFTVFNPDGSVSGTFTEIR